MKIGMVSAVYKPVVNGVTHMISLYKNGLEELGHEVTIFTLGEPDPQGDEPGVIRSPAIPLGDQGYQIGTRYTREARDLMREMDILHCHHLIFGVDLAHRYGRCPIVLTNHTRHDIYTSAYLPLPRSATDVLVRQIWPDYADMADVIIAPSLGVSEVMRRYGVEKPIKVIPNGVDLSYFLEPSAPKSKSDLDIPDSAVLAIYTGRLSEEKNMAVLMEQFAIAGEILQDLQLLLVGTGHAIDDIKDQVRELGLHGRVHLYGSVPYEEMPDLLAAGDLYVTASVSEVHPLALIEAMATGLPVAASRSPGISDTVEHGRTGFLTSDPDRGLAAAMVALAGSAALRRAMGKAARESSREYDIRRTVAETVALYESLRLERPDLTRQQKHGRWHRPPMRLPPRLRELVDKIRLDEEQGDLTKDI